MPSGIPTYGTGPANGLLYCHLTGRINTCCSIEFLDIDIHVRDGNFLINKALSHIRAMGHCAGETGVQLLTLQLATAASHVQSPKAYNMR